MGVLMYKGTSTNTPTHPHTHAHKINQTMSSSITHNYDMLVQNFCEAIELVVAQSRHYMLQGSTKALVKDEGVHIVAWC